MEMGMKKDALPLPLLVPRIGADDEHNAPPLDDFALFTHATNAGADLHVRTRKTNPPADRPEAIWWSPRV
jgi:hypothetical protein